MRVSSNLLRVLLALMLCLSILSRPAELSCTVVDGRNSASLAYEVGNGGPLFRWEPQKDLIDRSKMPVAPQSFQVGRVVSGGNRVCVSAERSRDIHQSRITVLLWPLPVIKVEEIISEKLDPWEYGSPAVGEIVTKDDIVF